MATLQANVDAIVEASGIASINRPNYGWAFDHREISRVEGASMLEVFNGHPAVNLFGAPASRATKKSGMAFSALAG